MDVYHQETVHRQVARRFGSNYKVISQWLYCGADGARTVT